MDRSNNFIAITLFNPEGYSKITCLFFLDKSRADKWTTGVKQVLFIFGKKKNKLKSFGVDFEFPINKHTHTHMVADDPDT